MSHKWGKVMTFDQCGTIGTVVTVNESISTQDPLASAALVLTHDATKSRTMQRSSYLPTDAQSLCMQLIQSQHVVTAVTAVS